MRGFAGESSESAAALHLHPTLFLNLSPILRSLSVSVCIFLPHKPLCLEFKSIQHPSLCDIPPEKVNNVWQRDREAQRMEDSLASISILSVSQGNREC